ncbi:50S ribosomal protein L10, partial [Candidatus Bathyarchaeota archaeon]
MAAIKGQPKPWKLETVEELKRILTKYPVIAIVSFRGVPASQMQEIRRKYRDKFLLKVAKNTLLEKAIESLNEEYG